MNGINRYFLRRRTVYEEILLSNLVVNDFKQVLIALELDCPVTLMQSYIVF